MNKISIILFLLSVFTFLISDKVKADDKLDHIKNKTIAFLATDYDGMPFGSIVGYILDEEGNPVIFISDLARHTNNINEKKKCSLTLFEEDKDNPFNSSRITFIGKADKVEDEETIKKLMKSYIKKYPTAEEFSEFSDFNFYCIKLEKIFRIGGFGDINWDDLNDYKKLFINK